MRRLLVGLTGGLASGKSTVARLCHEAGCTVIDADQVVAELYRPGSAGASAVRELFGAEVLTAEGAVDRPKVAEKVFGDAGLRKQLEEAVHPLVKARTEELLQASEGLVVYEATLLVEAGRADRFDVVVSVEADPELRLRRAVERGMDEAGARARLEAQGDGAQRRARADHVLHNDGDLAELAASVEALLAQLVERLHAVPPNVVEILRRAVLVTGNQNKALEAARLLGGVELETVAVDLPEVQGLDAVEVLQAKADVAWERLRRSIIVEDTGLELDAMNGFPGPLVKWMLQAMGKEGIARTGLELGDAGVWAHCALYYRDGERRVVAHGRTGGTLVLPARGEQGFGWDGVFQPLGHQRTYAEMAASVKDLVGHRGRAWRGLVEELG